MKKLIAISIFLPVIFFACNDPEEYKKIVGEWQCTKWIASDGRDICNGNVRFHFRDDKTYSSKLGAQEEQGIYDVSGNKLSVTAENKMEIKVEITEATDSTMEWIMNNGGNLEKLSLRKVEE